MKRLLGNTTAALLASGLLFTCAHQDDKMRPPEVVVTQPPRPAAVCQTPFAIVPAAMGQVECRLAGPNATAWAAVPVPGSDGEQANLPRRFGSAPSAFCVYEWRDLASSPDADAFARIGGAPDCPMVAMMAPASKSPELPKFVWDPLVKVFEQQARGFGDADWKKVYAKHIAKPKIPVRVAVVDGTVRKAGEPGSVHGFAVRRVISSLVCQDPNSPDCQKRVQPNVTAPSANARPADCCRDTPDFVTFHQLYDALAGVIKNWQPKQEHLVINMSIGWDSLKVDPDDALIKRIEDLLKRASCMGAIVVAAAGNVTGTEGPLYPAAWEAQEANAKACADVKLPAPKGGDAYAPLVHAVGAVDASDQRMEIVRRWGQPRLSAYGMAVTAPGSKDMPYSPPLSGTSMSAAIVSGIAAAVWSARPELEASQVMALVYEGGVGLDGGEKSKRAKTEFCVGEPFGPCGKWPVRRAVLCGALAKALPGDKLACATPKVPDSHELPYLPKGTIAKDPAGDPPPCRVTGCGTAIGPMAVQRPSGALPQPGVAGCPGCTLTKNYWGVNWDLLWGYPTSIPPSMYATILRTYDPWWQAQDYLVANPTTPNVLYTQWMHVQQNTYAAVLYWYYSLGGWSVVDTTPLIVN